MHLNSCDQIKDIVHTPTIYIYKSSAALDATDAISRLKDSLGKALVLFYPLAGRLYWAAEGGGRLELHCNGKGATIVEAECESAVEDFGDFTPIPAMQLYIPSVDYTTLIEEIPLISVQLTRFRCGGISIGLGVCHVMADGPSALHFVHEWAKIARGGGAELVVPPYLNRKVLDTDKPLTYAVDQSLLRHPPTLIGQENNLKKPITVAFLSLSKIQIENLRNKANVDFDSGRGCSRFEAVAAHIWRCIIKARRHAAEQQSNLLFVVDFRNRMNPPLPKNYFGNAVTRAIATDKSGSLLSNSIGAASKKIREAVEKVTDETVRGFMDYAKRFPDVGIFRSVDNNGRPKSLASYENPNLAMVSWIGMPLYGADFGWGKEIHMGPVQTGNDGKCFIIPGHDDDGSFKIVIWLFQEHMADFKKCFYDHI